MAQAGIHSLIGLAMRKIAPKRNWLLYGIILGNLFPDADNLAVAFATISGRSTDGLHRTFTHSIFLAGLLIIVFKFVAWLTKRRRWGNLGVGLGLGVLMHILLDVLIWFDGVKILWPIPFEINIWQAVVIPDWWSKLMMPLENLLFALYFLTLNMIARKFQTNQVRQPRLQLWTGLQGILFLAFLIMVYTMDTGFITIFGTVYLLSLGLALGITIKMRETIEAVA